MSGLDAKTTILGSSVFQFRVDYEQSKQLPIGEAVHSDVVSAGGHLWRIEFYPRGRAVQCKGEYTSIFLRLISKSSSVKAIFGTFMIDRDGQLSTTWVDLQRLCQTFEEDKVDWGWYQFEKVTNVEKKYLIEWHFTIICTIMVIDDSPIPVPPSDISAHIGRLLDHTDGTDVSFVVDGVTFPAHRAVLAARSPVFKEELFGSMAKATMSSITLHDITPATFKTMLRFIYTDELPAEDEHQDSSTEMIQNLLAAANRYALDRLKFICARKLWDKVSVYTVATILACAETYNCQELKKECMDFFALEENFKEAVFTDGYASVLKFPLIVAELKRMCRASELKSRRTVATTRSSRARAMSKRAKMSGLDAKTTILGSSVFQFSFDYEQSKQLPIGEAVHSDVVSAGGHLWRIEFYPRGHAVEYNGEYTSIFLSHLSKSSSVNAIFEAFMIDRDGEPLPFSGARMLETFETMGNKNSVGWRQFIEISTLEKKFLTEGHVTFVCAIMVIDDSPIPVPPSDIVTHLGRLLDQTDGTDVSFVIGNETFHAHRAVLAARSPVFKPELFGFRAESTMSSITLHGITPATFKTMLRFIYTDELPAEDEHQDCSTEMIQNLLAAADRYALDRLKFVCARKLWDKVSVYTVATILACAETYNCQELKKKCMDFFVQEENFKEAIVTDVSFVVDGETFPAHRAVLAARSPVFKEELFGSMAKATMSSITLHDITPATFKTMLRFIYTDELPAEDEHQDSSTEMIQNLLAAADRYALDRLKFVCARKLWDKVSVYTVATILACAETYNCQELKKKCMDFFVQEENFKEAIFTDGYASVLKFPLIVAELKRRFRT